MRYEISFNLDNEAFEVDTDAEIARILRELADKVSIGRKDNHLYDINGNRIGFARIVREMHDS